MRAAQLENNVVINFAEVDGFDSRFVDPKDAVIGSIYDPDNDIFTGPPPPTPLVPAEITMRQARLALLNAGLLTSVSAAIAGMSGPDGDRARIYWEYSSAVRRDESLVATMAGVLHLSSAQVDLLFIQGESL